MDFLSLGLALVPVLLFLVALTFLDSFKLVTPWIVVRSILVGAAVAILALAVNSGIAETFHLSRGTMRHTVGPVAEELLKAVFVVFLIRTRRVGFLVDAAIHGFAVGAGFAVAENVYYLVSVQDNHVLLWTIRGFGTALIHGTATAVFAMISKNLSDRRKSPGVGEFIPGLVPAILIHAAFNLVILPPLAATFVLLTISPLLIVFVFERSEKSTQEWLGVNLDSEVELLDIITSGEMARSHVGTYLESLRSHFSGAVVGDMLCLLRIHLELSILAKGVLIARAAGMDMALGDNVRESLEELRYLERSIGKTGRMALLPILAVKSRDLWQIYMLKTRTR
jgi:protease PrsW